MRLSEIPIRVTEHLQADPFISTFGVEVIANVSADHDVTLESALRDKGVALVVVLASGEPLTKNGPDLHLSNEVVVSVLVNPARNQSELEPMEITEIVLERLHQAAFADGQGLHHVFTVDTPAYEAGPLDRGLIIYFCNFQVKTIQ